MGILIGTKITPGDNSVNQEKHDYFATTMYFWG